MPRLDSDRDTNITFYIHHLFKKQGRDYSKCELCEQPIIGKAELHHTKYEGATIYDIKISCHSCNEKHINKGLT